MVVFPDHPYLGAGAFPVLENGIYQMRRYPCGRVCVREKFYEPSDQTQPNKIISQQKFADAVLSWQGLTTEQKNQYNKRAIGKHMSGYNLFLRIYMKS